MTQVAQPPVVCPGCGARYRWREDFGGKELACKCGHAFRVAARGVAAVQAKPAAAAPPAFAGYAALGSTKSAVERALEERADEVQPSRIRDLYAPIVLLPVGAVGSLVVWSQVMGNLREGAIAYAVVLALQLFVFLPLMFASLTAVAKMFELALGNVLVVLLKLAALTLGAAAVCDPIFTAIMTWHDFDWQCVIAGFGVYFILVGLPTLVLFEMAIYEAALMALLVFLPRVVAAFVVAAAIPDYFR